MAALYSGDLLADQALDLEERYVLRQGEATIEPVDLTGCTAQLMVRVAYTDVSPTLAISTTPNVTGAITFELGPEGELNVVAIRIFGAALATLLGFQGVYDLVVTLTSGLPVKVAAGAFLVGGTATHS